MSPQDGDRRLAPRVLGAVIGVEYVFPSPQVRDLSVSGMYLLDPRPVQMGQTVELLLRLADATTAMKIGAMVRRVDRGRGFAVEFIQLDSADRRRIKEFVSRAGPDKTSAGGGDGLD